MDDTGIGNDKKLDRLMELEAAISQLGRNFDAASGEMLKEIEPRLRVIRDSFYAARKPLTDELSLLREELSAYVLKNQVTLESASGKYVAKLYPGAGQWDFSKLDAAKTTAQFSAAKNYERARRIF